jgi:prevent-host-death family protein
MERRVSATEARVHFGELMRRVVEQQETVVVEHSGNPRVVVLPVDRYQRLVASQAEGADWRELVRRSRAQVRADLGDRVLTPPEEVVREMREERDAQLVAVR